MMGNKAKGLFACLVEIPRLTQTLSSSSLCIRLLSSSSLATSSGHAMEKAAKNNANVGEKAEAKKEKEEKKMEKMIEEKIGQPPEKPLPGDCCGSGCQSCVWDMYYDDLELYNNKRDALLKSISPKP